MTRAEKFEIRVGEGFRTASVIGGIFVAWMVVNGIIHTFFGN